MDLFSDKALLRLLPKSYQRSFRKDENAWRFLGNVCHISQFLSVITLIGGVLIMIKVKEFHRIAYGLAEQSGYQGRLKVPFLDDCTIVAGIVMTAALIAIIFGMAGLYYDHHSKTEPSKLVTLLQAVLITAVMATEVIAAAVLVQLQQKKNLVDDLSGLAKQYADLPNHLTTDGSISVLRDPDGATADANVLRATVILNALHMMMSCCGTDSGYNNFRSSLYFKEVFPVFVPPVYCCKFQDPVARILKDKSCYSTAGRYSKESSNFNTGCTTLVGNYIDYWLWRIALAIVLTAIIKLCAYPAALIWKRCRTYSKLYGLWLDANAVCSEAIERIHACSSGSTPYISVEPTSPPISRRNSTANCPDFLSKLDDYREIILRRLPKITHYLHAKQPAKLIREYGQLPEEILEMMDIYRKTDQGMSKPVCMNPDAADTAHPQKDIVDDLCEVCDDISNASTPISQDRYIDAVQRGAMILYAYCRNGAKEATSFRASRYFAAWAEDVARLAGTLLHNTTPDSWDSGRTTAAGKLKAVAKQVLFTCQMSREGSDARLDAQENVTPLLQSVENFLMEAKLLTVHDNHQAAYDPHWKGLAAYALEIRNNLAKLSQHLGEHVPGVVDCGEILHDTETARQHLTDVLQQGPLAEFCTGFLDVQQMSAILDKMVIAAFASTSEGLYCFGQLIIQLDSRRRFLHLETAALAAAVGDGSDQVRLFGHLDAIFKDLIALLTICRSHLEKRSTDDSSIAKQLEIHKYVAATQSKLAAFDNYGEQLVTRLRMYDPDLMKELATSQLTLVEVHPDTSSAHPASRVYPTVPTALTPQDSALMAGGSSSSAEAIYLLAPGYDSIVSADTDERPIQMHQLADHEEPENSKPKRTAASTTELPFSSDLFSP
ncbi:uncharacterized protein LOC129597383 isoform X2 [Paramacrobiotus metropolitanus]|uniref:uncharacterized protein LOC129597383 isoform X2 n=1 Tax=Paramacrobiotus metropolitanus TaxID=2943436 RepID=UPI0024465209|nr:uncharacterized protein LOC129597383 isoform X2 [Paramacrobiotus metropolitanus]